MKKLTLLLMFQALLLMPIFAATDWVLGRNQIHNLLDAVEKGPDGVETPPSKYQNGVDGNAIDTKGHFENAALAMTLTDEITPKPDYVPSNDDKFFGIKAINWSGKKYQQKVSVPIVEFKQANTLEDDDKSMELNDLKWLETIDFSTNYFRSVSILGRDDMTALTTVNLSNNPTLESLSIIGCPELTSVDITNCELTIAEVQTIQDNVTLKSGGTLAYALQGAKESNYASVDINELLTANGVGTVSSWSVMPVSNENGVYVFDVAQNVVLTLSNPTYPGIEIKYNYNLLTAQLVTINKTQILCTIAVDNLTNPGVAPVVGDEVQITVTPNGYYNLVSFKIDGIDATLDANNQYILELEEGEYTLEATYNTEFSGLGSGTLGEPYQIANQLQLNQVRYYPTAYYLLTDDIALTLSGQGWEPIANFAGEFDGNGKAITGLMINRPNTGNVGVFSHVKANGVVKNLAVNASTITSKEITGGIVGRLSDNAKIKECFFSGTISCTGEDVGGIVGWVEGSALVENCYSSADVTAKDRAGGVVGRLKDDNAEVRYSYSTGVMTATQYSAGGVVGSYNAGSPKITACFALNSNVSGNGDSKRIIGWDQNSVKSNNYAFSEMLLNESVVVDGTTTNSNGANISKANAKLSASYTSVDWDFDDIWEMGLGYTLPVLRNVSTSAQPNALPTHLDNGTDVNANNEVSFKVYPTITDGIVNIIDKPSDSMVYVFNLSGMRVKQTNTSTVDLSTLATGVYFIHVDNSIVKIIKR